MPTANATYLGEPLSRWWRNVAGPRLTRSVYLWTGPGGDRELIHRLIAEDAEIQALQLINLLGTPQGQLIADAVTDAMIPEPWATFVREALTIIAQQQSATRQQQIGQIGQGVAMSLLATSLTLLLHGLISGSRPAGAVA